MIVTHVIKYQLPDEIETYTHRSGRTGRAAEIRNFMVIVTKKSELRKIKAIENKIQQALFPKKFLPEWNLWKYRLYHLANKF